MLLQCMKQSERQQRDMGNHHVLDVTKVKRIDIRVGQYMLEWRGRDCGSIIVGSSVHNQRIECFLRDMY